MPKIQEHEELWEAYWKDPSEHNLNELVRAYMNLVYHVYKRKFSDFPQDKPDYISHGSIGLVKAIQGFNQVEYCDFLIWGFRCIYRAMMNVYRHKNRKRQIRFKQRNLSRRVAPSTTPSEAPEILKKLFKGYERYYDAFLAKYGEGKKFSDVWQTTGHSSYKGFCNAGLPKIMAVLKSRLTDDYRV